MWLVPITPEKVELGISCNYTRSLRNRWAEQIRIPSFVTRSTSGSSESCVAGTDGKRFFRQRRDGFVALCPELDIASQGDNIEQARDNLQEALELFFESAPEEEINRRLHAEINVT